MAIRKLLIYTFIVSVFCGCVSHTDIIGLEIMQPTVPVLTLKENNPALRLTLIRNQAEDYRLESVKLSLAGTTDIRDVEAVRLYISSDGAPKLLGNPVAQVEKPAGEIVLRPNFPVGIDTLVLWVSVKLSDRVELVNRIKLSCTEVKSSRGKIRIPDMDTGAGLRVGVALRQHGQDGVHTSRIPGLTVTKKGTLIAVYDARRESDRDLQGDMDICINRSADGGKTWSPMQPVLDMGRWGGLPEKFNGVSDACILSDDNTGDLYVAGLWMHGVLDSRNGEWVKGLSDTSSIWNHQWRSFGSQPGYDVKRSSQFLITKSVDDGLTWSEPRNITRQVKQEKWWLLAPAPGHGITLSDGTLVFPAEGRDENGLQFSTIMWSKDGGDRWNIGTAAATNVNECMAVELSDGAMMLNMRDRSNNGKMEGNGRAVAVTKDLGQTWQRHPTSNSALIEPACMAAIHRHFYTENGQRKSVLFFMNPNSKTRRVDMTVKTSFDDGNTWPEQNQLLLDEYQGSGYSCITSIDEQTIGVLYEGSQADLIFQQIPIKDLLNH